LNNANLKPWQAGQSGNPNGRPARTRDFRLRCQEFMQKSGWAQLQGLAMDPTSQHHFRALELIAAYAVGRPTQPVSGDPDPDMPPLRVTVTFDRAEDTDSLPT
jgi:hypothetical protein